MITFVGKRFPRGWPPAKYLRFHSTITDKYLPLLRVFYDREVWRPQYTPTTYPNTDALIFREPRIPLFDADDHIFEYVEVPEWEDQIGARRLRPEPGEEFYRPLWRPK